MGNTDYRKITFGAPISIKWELTYACNLKCSHCLVNAGSCVPNEASKPSLVSKIIRRILELEPFTVLLSGGEPLLHKGIFDIIASLSKYGMEVNVESNGTLITSKTARNLRKVHCKSISLSIHGASPQTHDMLVGVKGSWKKTIDSFKLLTRHNVRTNVIFAVTKFNIYDIDDVVHLSKSLGAERIYIDEIASLGRAAINWSSLKPTSDQLGWLVHLVNSKYQELVEKDEIILNLGLIDYLRELINDPPSMCVISPTAEVRIYDFFPIVVGNLLIDDAKELWGKTKDVWRHQLVRNLAENLRKPEDIRRLKDLSSRFKIAEYVI